MPAKPAVAITGLGVVSPIGIGIEAFWQSLSSGRSGVGPIDLFDASRLPVRIAGQIRDFDPRQYVRPRKSLKVMSRDAQFAVASADLARQHGSLDAAAIDADRFGVVFGADSIRATLDESSAGYRACIVDGRFDFRRWGEHALAAAFPLSMLKLLPNMLACHISIIQDARGPNNSLCHQETSSLLSIGEAARVIQRGWADAMLAGGASSRIHPYDFSRFCLYEELSHRNDEPERACRPFDADRDGQVRGEGAATLLLESCAHAAARRATVLAEIVGQGSAAEPVGSNQHPQGHALRRAVLAALDEAGVEPGEVGFVSAHGLSTHADDAVEARTLAELFGSTPVTGFKSYFGNLGAATGAVEAVAVILALAARRVPPTLNYERPDADCPIEVVRGEPWVLARPRAVLVNQTQRGQAVALVIAAGGS